MLALYNLFFKPTQNGREGLGGTDGDISCKPCQAYSKMDPVSQSDDNEDAADYDYII